MYRRRGFNVPIHLLLLVSWFLVDSGMTRDTMSDQVFFVIISRLASKFLVVDLRGWSACRMIDSASHRVAELVAADLRRRRA